MPKLRIAAILRALPGASGRGGVSYQVHHLCQGLVRRGHDLTVFSIDPAPEDATYAVHRIAVADSVRERRAFLYLGFPRRVRELDFSGFDLIHAHGDNQFLTRRPAPVVRTYWGSDLGELGGDFRAGFRPEAALGHLFGYACEWLANEHSDRVVAISENTRRCLPFVREVIPPGVDLRNFRGGEAKSEVPSILYVAGTLGGRKRGRLLLETFRNRILPIFPEAELWLVCPEAVEGAGIRWHGMIPASKQGMAALASLYRRAWLFCLPSSYEGFGLPYVEAMASGTAVVATPNPGACEILQGGMLGVIAEPDAIGEAIVGLLRDDERRLALAERALGAAVKYDLERVIDRYEALYGETVAEWRRSRSVVSDVG